MEAGKRTINDIFNGNKILEIPFFQRAYVWDTPQWERFLIDMEHVSLSNKPYFLGSVILKQQLTDSQQSVGDKRTVIDGQQRLTTLNIFFKVLSLKISNDYLKNLFRLPMKNNEIALLHNHNDVVAFNRILDLNKEDKLTAEDNVTRAYTYFSENIDVKKLNFQNILTNIMFVGIDLGTNEDEQQIFDTINSLGVKLTTAELLKNFFFNRDEISIYNTYWKNVFEKDEETKNYWDKEINTGKRAFIDLFFYSYLQIKIQDKTLEVKTEDKIEYTKVDQLFESYKSFIRTYLQNDKKSILAEIKDYALLFQENFNYEIVESELSCDSGIERINAIIFGLDTSTLIPYVLYVLKHVSSDTERNQLFDFIETYILRRIIVRANNKNYSQLYSERLIGNRVLSKEDFLKYLDGQDEKANYLPSDEELKKGFNEANLTNKQAAGILYFIESKIRNRQLQSTQLLGIDKYSLEHLMPKKWENYWGKINDQEEKLKRNRKLLTLGNLAIITQSLNASIKDRDWKTKLNGRGTNKGLSIYSAGLETMSQYLTLDEWNEETIENRAEFLFAKAKEIWKV